MSELVTNSVQQINAECTEMLNITESLPYMDIGIMARDLKDLLKELNDVFDNHPEDYRRINQKKTEVEIKAIQLENFIQLRSDFYRERHKLRGYVSVIHKDIRDILMAKMTRIRSTGKVLKANDEENVDALKWTDYFTFTTRLLNQSNHILFELSPEDSKFLKRVVVDVKEYKENYPNEFGKEGV